MNSNRTLLIPIDFSNASKIAVRFALSNEYNKGDKIILSHCYRLIADDPLTGTDAPRTLQKAIEQRIFERYEKFHKALKLEKFKQDIELKLRVGFTANCIKALASECKANLIIMGLKDGKKCPSFLELIQTSSTPILLVSEKLDTKKYIPFSEKTLSPNDFSSQTDHIFTDANAHPHVPYLVLA